MTRRSARGWLAGMGEIVPLRRTRDQEPLWRELIGDQLRQERLDRGDRLVDVAERAGVSPQYLSEVERGLKDPSSEMLAALAGSLELTVRELSVRAAQMGGAAGATLCLAA
jgi:DNA-binding XRE family transcriptional regulator